MAGVRFEHVYKSFDQVEIVHDISMQIKDQEFLVLVGPSGSGKSTCLRMVAGLEEPSTGRIYIGDRLVNGVDPKDRNIAMVFQRRHHIGLPNFEQALRSIRVDLGH